MKTTVYTTPFCQVIPLDNLTTLCSSPVSGGNEAVGFEDWSRLL